MSEVENTANKNNIRGQLNLVFASMKMLATILDLTANNQMAREAAATMAESIWKQSSMLQHDVGKYLDEIAGK